MEPTKTEKLGITITAEMHKALNRVAKRRGATIANLTRMAVVEFLRNNGELVEDVEIQWGGNRRGKKDES